VVALSAGLGDVGWTLPALDVTTDAAVDMTGPPLLVITVVATDVVVVVVVVAVDGGAVEVVVDVALAVGGLADGGVEPAEVVVVVAVDVGMEAGAGAVDDSAGVSRVCCTTVRCCCCSRWSRVVTPRKQPKLARDTFIDKANDADPASECPRRRCWRCC
jgi:hypothetical protein